jgi:hypothetical protein
MRILPPGLQFLLPSTHRTAKPDPMIEPSPVSISAIGPMFRCIELSRLLQKHVGARLSSLWRKDGLLQCRRESGRLMQVNRYAARSSPVAPISCIANPLCPYINPGKNGKVYAQQARQR